MVCFWVMPRANRGGKDGCVMLGGVSRIVAGCVLVVAGSAIGSVIEVGSGGKTAGLVVNFKDGAAYEFRVHFDGEMTGMGLLDVVEAHSALVVQKQDFGWGVFVDGLAFEGHRNAGYGGGDDWWQYWTRGGVEQEWEASMIGASDRVVLSGQFDGWVYGRATEPVVPEPVGIVFFVATASLLMRRRQV